MEPCPHLMKTSTSNLLLPLYNLEKLTIVFDLDETLVRAVLDPRALTNNRFDFFFINGGNHNTYVSFRPFLCEMLN